MPELFAHAKVLGKKQLSVVMLVPPGLVMIPLQDELQ
jgi:hypothetical protein